MHVTDCVCKNKKLIKTCEEILNSKTINSQPTNSELINNNDGINKIDAVKLVIITDMPCEPINDDKNWK